MEEDLNYLTVSEAEEIARLTKVIKRDGKKLMDFALYAVAVPDKDQFLSDYVEVKILSDIAGSHKATLHEYKRIKSNEIQNAEEALDMLMSTFKTTIREMKNNLLSSGYCEENVSSLMTQVGKISRELEERGYFRTVQSQKEKSEG